MSGAGKVWNNWGFFNWIYRVSDAAARVKWLYSLIFKASINQSTSGFFYILKSTSKVGVAKTCEVYCVNGHHQTNISNIKISRHTFVRLLGCFDEIWRKSVISIYPFNSLRVYVFLPKSNEKFYLMKVRKQLAPRQEIIISPPEIANHWDKGTFWRQRR